MMRKLVTFAVVSIFALSLPAWAAGGYVGASYINTDADFKTQIEDYSTSSDGWKICSTGYQRTYEVTQSTAGLDFKLTPGSALA